MGLFTPKSYVGLDIGHSSIKVAQMEKHGLGWRVSRFGTGPTPKDTVKDGVVIDPAVLGIAIKRLLKENHISASSASIAVSGGAVVVRNARIPKMTEATLRKSIKFEASRYIPSSAEESYIDFEIVGTPDETNIDISVAAAPRDLVDSRIAACDAAGLDVETVEVAGFALQRSIAAAFPEIQWADRIIALVDFGGSSASISLVSNGKFELVRSIPVGGNHMTEALESYFQMSKEDAELGKSQLDVSQLVTAKGPIENPPLRVIQPILDDLARELRRSINYWQSQHNDGPKAPQVDELVLTGGGGKLTGLELFLSAKLAIPTRFLALFSGSTFQSGHGPAGDGAEFAIATGLTMPLAKKGVSASAKPSSKTKVEPIDAEVTEPSKKRRFGRKAAPVTETVPLETVAGVVHDVEVAETQALSVDGPDVDPVPAPKASKAPRLPKFGRKKQPAGDEPNLGLEAPVAFQPAADLTASDHQAEPPILVEDGPNLGPATTNGTDEDVA